MTNRSRTLNIVRFAILALVGVVFLVPLAWMLSTSLKADDQIMSSRIEFLPREAHWENYARAIASFPFPRYFVNSSIIAILRVAGTVLTGAMGAYAFSKLHWRGRDAVFAITIATMFIPAQVLIVPTYLIFSKLRWINSYMPLIVPSFLGGGAFSIFMLRQFFTSIPDELLESGRIDGASEAILFSRIVMPLSVPALITLGLFTFIFAWNDFMGPLIYLLDPAKWTLPIGLRAFQQKMGTQWNLLMAASTLTSMPLLILYFFGQESVTRGFTLRGGIK